MNDQAQRDLLRLFAELFQRTLSHAATGAVVRPRRATSSVRLGETLDPAWQPSCVHPITVMSADPSERPLALVIVPASTVSRSGAGFTAYALHAPGPTLTLDLLRAPPDWLVREAGGYDNIAGDLQLLMSRSEVAITTTDCGAFAYSIVTGIPR
jgi:hypothetical protein